MVVKYVIPDWMVGLARVVASAREKVSGSERLFTSKLVVHKPQAWDAFS
jgi:hypothetical protein